MPSEYCGLVSPEKILVFSIYLPTLVLGILISAGFGVVASTFNSTPTESSTPSMSFNSSTPYSQLSQEAKTAWMNQLHFNIVFSRGCFNVTYPNTTWQSEPCAVGDVPPPPLLPGSTSVPIARPATSAVATVTPETVGGGYGESAYGGGSFIGSSIGSFSQESGFSSETDSVAGSNSYTLQMNTNDHTCSSAYFTNADCWEQFVFQQWKTTLGYTSQVYIVYWLLGYGSNCPSEPGIIVWTSYNGSCYGDGPITGTPNESPANLGGSSLTGYSVVQGNAQDQVTYCDSGGHCYTNWDFTIFRLNSWWTISEFNVFGQGNGSQAVFTPSFNILVKNQLFGTSGGALTATCDRVSFTGETANLNIGIGGTSCYSGGNFIQFSEGVPPFTVNNSPGPITTGPTTLSFNTGAATPGGTVNFYYGTSSSPIPNMYQAAQSTANSQGVAAGSNNIYCGTGQTFWVFAYDVSSNTYSNGVQVTLTCTLTLTSSLGSIPAGGLTTSTITASLSGSTSGIVVSLSTNKGTLSASSCTTNTAGSCSVTLRSSLTAGTATISGSASNYGSASTTVTFSGTTLSNSCCTDWTKINGNWITSQGGYLDGSGYYPEIRSTNTFASSRTVTARMLTVVAGSHNYDVPYLRGKWIDDNNKVVMYLTTDGYLEIDAKLSGTWYYYSSVYTGASPTVWHTFNMVFSGSQVQGYLDGTLYISLNNSVIGSFGSANVSGYVGNNLEMQLDGVTVS